MKTKSLNRIGIATLVILAMAFSSFDSLNEDDKEKCETKIEIKQVEAQHALVIKAEVPTSEIGPSMGRMYGELFKYAEANNIQPAGPPFAVYYSFEMEGNTVFEAGLPVQSKTKAEGEISYKEFPSMKVASTLYKGAYEDMLPVYEAMEKYLNENNLESAGTSWEVYLTDPGEVASPQDNQTLVYFTIK